MGFAEGFNAGSGMVNRAYGMKLDRERFEREQANRDAQAARENERMGWERGDRQKLNSAVGNLETLQNTGVLQDQGTGLARPSAEMLYSEGYAGAQGPAALRDAAGDFAREEARMGVQRRHDPTAAVSARPATDVELTQGAQRVALARGDLGAWRGLETDRRATRQGDARKAEFSRIRGMKDNELADMFQQSVNANPDVPAMVDFDPKARKYVIVSKIPGIPTQQLSRAEMMNAVMGAWEAGNGDYAAGVQAMLSTAQTQRQLENSNFERSRGLSKDNADMHFKGLQADNDAARTRNDGARTRATVDAAKNRAEYERMGLVRSYEDPKTKEIREFYPVTTKNGVEWREFETPKGMRPITPKAAAGAGGPPREVPAEGTRLQDGAGVFQADGRGGRLSLDAPTPSKRAAMLAKAGFAKPEIEGAEWTPDGRYIAWGGLAYDVNDPRDLQELRSAMQQHAADSIAAREGDARGYTPRREQGYGTDPLAAERRMERTRARAYGITQR